jgi:hypothetical protein
MVHKRVTPPHSLG